MLKFRARYHARESQHLLLYKEPDRINVERKQQNSQRFARQEPSSLSERNVTVSVSQMNIVLVLAPKCFTTHRTLDFWREVLVLDVSPETSLAGEPPRVGAAGPSTTEII